MKYVRRRSVAGLFLAILIFNASIWAVPPGVTMIGRGLVNGASPDKSGFSGVICQASNPLNCVPKAVFGGWGSDVTYTGFQSVFVAAPDRGPFDGLTDVPYIDRLHFLRIVTNVGAPFPNIVLGLLDTNLLKNEFGQTFLGSAGAFAAHPLLTRRFDPEGIRVGPRGTIFVSDEYGPYIIEFLPNGQLLRRIRVPEKFAIDSSSADPTAELLGNTSGRQANRGMEGLAISPDGRYLFGIMQNALLQDNALNPGTTDRISTNTRILHIDLLTGTTREFIYQLEASNRGQGVSEILAINDHEFLVVERDNRSWLAAEPQAPTRKKIWKIDINRATDVSEIEGIQAAGLPANITPVGKVLFLDLLDPAFGLQGNNPADIAAQRVIAGKIEALAWGPDTRIDGQKKHVLYVVSDNDLNPAIHTQIYAFAIDASVIDYDRQTLLVPIYPSTPVFGY